MSDDKKHDLASLLPIKDEETGILIKWNRTTASFQINFEGERMYYSSFQAVMESATNIMQQFTNNEGLIVPTLPKDEKKATEHEMAINQKLEEESSEDDNTPPWLKN